MIGACYGSTAASMQLRTGGTSWKNYLRRRGPTGSRLTAAPPGKPGGSSSLILTYRGTDQIAVRIQHKDRLLTDPGAIEDVLAVLPCCADRTSSAT